jgi:pyruvate-formate lyase-activating enzyme
MSPALATAPPQSSSWPSDGQLEVRAFPPMVVVSVTNRCNLSCGFCYQPVMRSLPGFHSADLDWDLYEKLLGELRNHPGTILRLVADGEPLLHRRIGDMVRAAKEQGLGPVDITTSGYFLDEQKSEELLKGGLDVIDISLDAFTRDTYDQVRIGSNYHRVMANTHRFLQLRERFKAKTKVMVSFIKQPVAVPEVDDFVRYWTPLVDKVLLRDYHSLAGLMENPGSAADAVNLPNRFPCPYLWNRVNLTAEGHVAFCSQDWVNRTIVGDYRETTIEELWRGPIYDALRKSHMTMEFDSKWPCGPCRDWSAMQWGHTFVDAIGDLTRGED